MAGRKRISQAVDVGDPRDAPRQHIQCWFDGCAEKSICSIQTTTHRVNVCMTHYKRVGRYEPAPDRYGRTPITTTEREPGSDDE